MVRPFLSNVRGSFGGGGPALREDYGVGRHRADTTCCSEPQVGPPPGVLEVLPGEIGGTSVRSDDVAKCKGQLKMSQSFRPIHLQRSVVDVLAQMCREGYCRTINGYYGY